MRELVKVLKALSDPNRMRIMKMLQRREMCVCELAEALGISQPSVSRHMRILAEADLVIFRREGVWIHYLWNPSPSDRYAASLLQDLTHWLEEDPHILALLEKAAKIKREETCRRPARKKGWEASEGDISISLEPATQRKKVLFLCTGNSCRSQMAEGWARRILGDTVEANSAGTSPSRVDPRAIKVMAEVGVDISGQRSKHLEELAELDFDYVITLCDHAQQSCPVFPARVRIIHQGFQDPPLLALSAKEEEEALAHYRRIRDEIRGFVERLPEILEG